jgi:flagellar biosynthesis anti-sigma factor FlgM
MKIDDLGPVGIDATRLNRNEQAEAVSNHSGTTGRDPALGAGRDRVELSKLAEGLSGVAGLESKDRLARLEKLRADVAGGRYQVDSAAVARAMVSEAIGQRGPLAGGVE